MKKATSFVVASTLAASILGGALVPVSFAEEDTQNEATNENDEISVKVVDAEDEENTEEYAEEQESEVKDSNIIRHIAVEGLTSIKETDFRQ